MPLPFASRTERRAHVLPDAGTPHGAVLRQLYRHALAAALTLVLSVAGQSAGADDDLTGARRAAHERHRQTVAACHQAADPAACRRKADADLVIDLRRVQSLPAADATQRHRQQQQRLLRELEQAAPRPQPPPSPTPSSRPTPGRSLDR